MGDKSRKILIAGIGNILKSDDGLGPFVIDQIRRLELPRNIEVIDLDTQGYSILNHCGRYDKVIFIDAIRKGGKPGSTYKLKPQDVVNETDSSKNINLLSMHEVNLNKALAMSKALDEFPSNVIIIGCEPGDISTLGMGLTIEVSEAVPKIIKMILTELNVN